MQAESSARGGTTTDGAETAAFAWGGPAGEGSEKELTSAGSREAWSVSIVMCEVRARPQSGQKKWLAADDFSAHGQRPTGPSASGPRSVG